jgi:hypothetical protein
MSSVLVNYPYCANGILRVIFNGIGLFKLSLIKEGATGRVSQFIMPLKSVYIKNVCFSEQKCINYYLYNYNISVIKEMLCMPFQSCPLLAYFCIT